MLSNYYPRVELVGAEIGSHTFPASRSVDGEGRVRALDKQLLTIKRVGKVADNDEYT